MMKGLMGRYLNQKMALDRIRANASSTEDELNELKAWGMGMEKKLACSEQAREELEKQMKLLRQVLEDKEKEIMDAKDQLRQVKEEAIHKYRDSNTLLVELGISFAEGFDDGLCQVKTSNPNLDLSHVTIEVPNQSTAQPVHLESTKDLFADDALADNATIDLKGDGDAATKGQQNTINEGSRQPGDVEEDDALAVQ